MIVAHNLLAMNTQRQFGVNAKNKSKISEKLSSGYRINRAADDAAGLAISEKMRKQIKGLTQASDNAEDGISMVQIADGAMEEIQDMLDRCVQLSVKAANGTLSDSDRRDIQSEINQIRKEIDQIPEKTKFNETYVLKGDGEREVAYHDTGEVEMTGRMPSWTSSSSYSDGYMSDTYTTDVTCTYTDSLGASVTDSIPIKHSAAIIDFSAFDGSPSKIKDLVGNGFYTTCCTCNNHYSVEFTEGSTNDLEKSGNHYIYKIGIDGASTPSDLIDRIISGTGGGNPNNHYTMIAKDGDNLVVYDDRAKNSESSYLPSGATSPSWSDWENKSFNTSASKTRGKFGPGVAKTVWDKEIVGDYPYPQVVSLQIGADSSPDNKLEVTLPQISCRKLGINAADVLSIDSATQSIDIFGSAKAIVSQDRSRMGAYQNRLEHTIKNLDNVVENTTASESAIRDTDMVAAMVEYAILNILEQAGTSMMAQANQSNQGVLSLLS